jgi:hypothetical protein
MEVRMGKGRVVGANDSIQMGPPDHAQLGTNHLRSQWISILDSVAGT